MVLRIKLSCLYILVLQCAFTSVVDQHFKILSVLINLSELLNCVKGYKQSSTKLMFLKILCMSI